MKHKAFTLAETVISLTVIGVISILTIPAMMNDWKDIKYATAYKKMDLTIANGFGLMIAEGTIAGYSSTEDFVQNMGNYFSVAKVCDNNNLSKCFSSKISTLGGTISLSDIKKASNLGKNWTSDTNVNGIVLNDGMSMIIAYNKDGCSAYAEGRDAIIRSCVAIAYDLDGPGNHGKYVPYGEDNKKGIRDIGLINAYFVPGNNSSSTSVADNELASAQNETENYLAENSDTEDEYDDENNIADEVNEDTDEVNEDTDENEILAENVSEDKNNCTVNGRACTMVEYLYYLMIMLINNIVG